MAQIILNQPVFTFYARIAHNIFSSTCVFRYLSLLRVLKKRIFHYISPQTEICTITYFKLYHEICKIAIINSEYWKSISVDLYEIRRLIYYILRLNKVFTLTLQNWCRISVLTIHMQPYATISRPFEPLYLSSQNCNSAFCL